MSKIERSKLFSSSFSGRVSGSGARRQKAKLVGGKQLLISVALVTLAQAEAARAQAITQGWAGIVPGSNDYNNPVPYNTPLEACQSYQNSFVPRFGHQVYGLISVQDMGMIYYSGYGGNAPAVGCVMDSGQYGQDTIISIKGCTANYKLVNGVCLPGAYPVTAEPADCGCKGVPGQYPTAGDPVLLSTGTKYEEVTDYSSGGPFPIEIKRFYRSMNMPRDRQSIGFGMAWRTNIIGRRIDVQYQNYNIVVSREDGMQTRFLNPNNVADDVDWTPCSIEIYLDSNGQQTVQTQGDQHDRFYTEGSFWVYHDENDRRDYFYANQLRKSVWRGGYTRNYTYAADDYSGTHPLQISDSLGRVLNITWDGDLVSTITLPDGTKLQYTYEDRTADNNVPVAKVLTQVTRSKADGSVIDTTGYQYDTATGTQTPLLTGVIDAAGKTIDVTTYDDIGRVLTAQGPGGANATTVAYDDTNNTRSVTNALGQSETYTFAKAGSYYGNVDTSLLRMTSVARQASATVPAASMSFVPSGSDMLKTDWNGLVTRLTYGNYMNETSRVEDDNGLKRTITTTWSPTFHLPTQIVAPNLTVNLTYDTAGNVIKREELDTVNPRKPVSRVWNYTWNTLGLLTSVTGPRTDVVQTTSYTYDASGNLATVTDALNHVTTINSVDAAGRPTSVTDPNGVVTLMTYDPLGRVATVSVQGPTVATTTFGYDINGLLTSVTAANGVTLTYGYDDARRLTSIKDSAGNAMAFALDGLGNRTQTQIQTGSAQVLMAHSATFDSLGRLLTSIGAANQVTSFNYDNDGNLTKLIDPRNAVTQTAFDGLNRVAQTTDALNGITKLAYDGQDNVTSVTDAKLHATTYTVNGWGLITQTVSPDSGTTSFTYDLAGNVLTRTDARKIVTTYKYDALNRPISRTYSATGENVAYGYDSTANGNRGVGKLTSVTDQAGSASFTYDAYGNRIAEKRTIGTINYTTAYDYDLGGNLTKVTYPSGMIVNYQRDALGQVGGVTMQPNASAQPVTLASNIGYLPFGPMQNATLGNGVQLTNSYDLDYRLSSIQATGSSTLQSLALGYDPASNVSAITDAVAPSLNQSFQYDLLGRVTQGTGSYGTDNYTYDAVGNRLTRSLVNGGTTTNTTYTYTSTNNRLASAATGSTTLSYTYDAIGSRTAVKKGNSTQASYTYNSAGRLATGGTATLKYDAFGERSVETITGGGTHFIFGQSRQLLAEHSTTGALIRNYVYLNGKLLALTDSTGAISYVLNDQVGQPQKMLNNSGAVTWQRVAGIFGDTVSQPVGATSANPQRFPGQQYSANTNLNYNYFRDYDSVTGRYLEVDPIGLSGGTNPYAYAGNNPVDAVDPSGLACVSSGGTVHCSFPGGGPSVNFPAPEGWPSSFNGNSKNYHAYDKQVNVGNKSVDCIRRQIEMKPTPGHPSPASPGGTYNDATPSTVSKLIDAIDYVSSFGNDPGGYNNSPVYSYITRDTKTGGEVVVNVTLPGHPLFPGYVARTVGRDGSGTVVHNYGEGTGALQNPWSPTAGPIDSVWNSQTRDLANDCGCQR